MFKMNKGLTLNGQLLDENGKAVADQWVHVRQIRDRNARHRILSSVATAIGRFAKTDGDGYVTFAPLPRGKYNVEPSEGDYTPFSGDRYESTPIKGVFPLLTTTLDSSVNGTHFTLKGVPTVKIVAQYYDSKGNKTTGHMLHIWGRQDNMTNYWQTDARAVKGRVELHAPLGLKDAQLRLITNEHSSLRFQKSMEDPLLAGHTLKLGNLQKDVTGIRIIRYVAPILLVKPMDTDGNLLKSVKVSGQYADTSNPERIRFETQKDGRQRSKQLLPDEKCTITVTAPGHRPQSRTISLAEGTTSELALKLEPR